MARQGIRAPWESIPTKLRDDIDDICGSPIASAVNMNGGFSPGPAARCELDDGRTVFVKAVSAAMNEMSPRMHRREAAVLAVLPDDHPSPALIGTIDRDGWVVLVVEWIDGHTPTGPLTRGDVDRFLRLLERVASAGQGVRPPGVTSFIEQNRGLTGHWARLAAKTPDILDAWSARHVDELAALESNVEEAVLGDHLLHVDYRTDNVVFAASGQASDVVVDWPSASIGAPWVDLVGALPALMLDGGPAPADVFERHPLGATADPDAVTTLLAAMTGYLTAQALQPPPPGLPTLRIFQDAQARIARTWLADRLGW